MKKSLKLTFTIKLTLLSGFLGYLVGQYVAEKDLNMPRFTGASQLELSIGFSDSYTRKKPDIDIRNPYLNLENTIGNLYSGNLTEKHK